MPFTFEPLRIPEIIRVEARAFEDPRGFFLEAFKASDFRANGVVGPFVQDNLSYSRRAVLRGLHYQRDPHAQGKLVSVIRGEIFDVGVDLRTGSPTFGQWVGEILSGANHRLLYVPAGFAHGFCVLSDEAWVLYKTTAEYSAAHDAGIRWNDPEIGIAWPIRDVQLSEKDAALPPLAEASINFRYAG